MKLLYNAKCFDTAYVVEDWPWGYTLKTEARFWIETTKNGDRLCKQTLNPKNGRWCKPKKSTYECVAVLAITDEGKVTYVGLGKYSATQDKIADVLETIDFEKLTNEQKKQICQLNAWAEVMDNVTWEIRPATGTPEERAAKDKEQDQISRKLAGYANALATNCMTKNGLI